MSRGYFITAEGTDGSGKSTQAALIKEYIESMGYDAILVREPGGTKISEKIRNIILDPVNGEMSDTTELLLYTAARAQLVDEVIRPSLESGRTVICDRFLDSTLAYQGFGRGISFELITQVNRVALKGLTPDLTLFFDLRAEDALKRRLKATKADRIETEQLDFHMRVYEGFKKLALADPNRIKTVDAANNVGEIFADVKLLIDGLFTK